MEVEGNPAYSIVWLLLCYSTYSLWIAGWSCLCPRMEQDPSERVPILSYELSNLPKEVCFQQANTGCLM